MAKVQGVQPALRRPMSNFEQISKDAARDGGRDSPMGRRAPVSMHGYHHTGMWVGMGMDSHDHGIGNVHGVDGGYAPFQVAGDYPCNLGGASAPEDEEEPLQKATPPPALMQVPPLPHSTADLLDISPQKAGVLSRIFVVLNRA